MLTQALKGRKVSVQSRFYKARIDLATATPGTPNFSRARAAVTRERNRLKEIDKAQETLATQGLWKAIPNVVRALLH